MGGSTQQTLQCFSLTCPLSRFGFRLASGSIAISFPDGSDASFPLFTRKGEKGLEYSQYVKGVPNTRPSRPETRILGGCDTGERNCPGGAPPTRRSARGAPYTARVEDWRR
jgi:hypothetical protein